VIFCLVAIFNLHIQTHTHTHTWSSWGGLRVDGDIPRGADVERESLHELTVERLHEMTVDRFHELNIERESLHELESLASKFAGFFEARV
jgi:hypothetical protein